MLDFDLTQMVTDEERQRLRRCLAELDYDEQLRIRLPAADSTAADRLIRWLTSSGYAYQPSCSASDEHYLLVQRWHAAQK
jgi:hypothetical protein